MAKRKRRKNKKTLYAILGVAVLFLIMGVLFYFQTEQAVLYKSQCDLDPCPFGYTATGEICDDFTCTRGCIKEVIGGAGTYGSEQIVGGIKQVDSEMDYKWFGSGDGPTELTNKYYKYRTVTTFTITDRDPCGFWYADSASHEVYTKDIQSKVQSQVVASSGNPVAAGSVWSVGKLGDGTKNRALGQYIAYTGTTPRGGEDACGSEGELSMYLYYKVADLKVETLTTTTTCHYDCNSASDCGSKQTAGNPYCSGNNLVQDFTVPVCNRYSCSTTSATETISTCDYKCESGACVADTGVIIDTSDELEDLIDEEIIIDTETSNDIGGTTEPNLTEEPTTIGPIIGITIVGIIVVFLIIIMAAIIIRRKRK